MMGRHSPGSFAPTLVLALLCLALVAVITVDADRPLFEGAEAAASPSDLPLAAPRETDVTIEARFAMPPLGGYAEVLARPPFATTRRPPPPAAAQSASSTPLAATLVGVILGSGGRRALVEHGEPAQVTRVSEGQEIDGWTITAIQRDRIILRRAEESDELKIKDRPSPSQPAQDPPGRPDATLRSADAAPPPSRVRRLTAAQIPPFIPGPLQPPIKNGAPASPAASAGSSAAPAQRMRRPFAPGGAGG
jgi:hypothetical protein